MVTTLTNTGWFGPVTNGVWTNKSNKVIDLKGGIVNLGSTVDTLDGKDLIIGSGGIDNSNAVLTGLAPIYFGIENLGAITTGRASATLIGTAIGLNREYLVYGVYNEAGASITVAGGNNNSISGNATGDGTAFPGIFSIAGIYNRSGSITIGNGNNNSIKGVGIATVATTVDEGTGYLSSGIFNRQGGSIAIGNGNNNSIIGIGGYYNGIYNRGSLTIGDGNNNSICGTGISDGAYGIYNQFVGAPVSITLGNGNNNSVKGISIGKNGIGIVNEAGCSINMGDGNDSIFGSGNAAGILNAGDIFTGGGNDTVIADGGFTGTGSVFLGEGNDYLKGFGSGNFNGGNGKDTLELTRGNYTVGISGATVSFTNGSVTMSTSAFEMLIAGATNYNFNSLQNGQTIQVV